ncbi:MAG: ParB/RepB/Spo0J family partition protein [Solitalea-like symbiont of Acarus siro]
MSSKKTSLGKGLEALLKDSYLYNTSSQPSERRSVAFIPTNKIQTNPFQPRKEIKHETLVELSESIKVHGLIQPITVREIKNGSYQLISGERRLKASKMAMVEEVPVYIRTANDQDMLEMGLVENVQREDLNAIEIAISIKRIIEECNLKQEEVSTRLAKSRSTITNYLRLLKLAPEIQIAISNNDISMGHAKALLSVQNNLLQVKLFRKTIKQNLSVRKLEELIKNSIELKEEKIKVESNISTDEQQSLCKGIEKMIIQKTGIEPKVKININSYKGEIKFIINSKSELEYLSSIFEGLQDNQL